MTEIRPPQTLDIIQSGILTQKTFFSCGIGIWKETKFGDLSWIPAAI